MQTKLLFAKALLTAAVLVSASPCKALSKALDCPQGMTWEYRPEVVDRVGEATAMYQNLWSVAEHSCRGSVPSNSHWREAMEAEYQARVAALEGIDNNIPGYVDQATRDFVEELINPIRDHLYGSSVLTKELACQASLVVHKAQAQLLACYQQAFRRSVQTS